LQLSSSDNLEKVIGLAVNMVVGKNIHIIATKKIIRQPLYRTFYKPLLHKFGFTVIEVRKGEFEETLSEYQDKNVVVLALEKNADHEASVLRKTVDNNVTIIGLDPTNPGTYVEFIADIIGIIHLKNGDPHYLRSIGFEKEVLEKGLFVIDGTYAKEFIIPALRDHIKEKIVTTAA